MQPKTLSLKLGGAATMEPARSEAAIVQPPPLPPSAAFPDSFQQTLCNGAAGMSPEEILAELVEIASRERVSDLQIQSSRVVYANKATRRDKGNDAAGFLRRGGQSVCSGSDPARA
jgi:hypothetical protein